MSIVLQFKKNLSHQLRLAFVATLVLDLKLLKRIQYSKLLDFRISDKKLWTYIISWQGGGCFVLFFQIFSLCTIQMETQWKLHTPRIRRVDTQWIQLRKGHSRQKKELKKILTEVGNCIVCLVCSGLCV